MGHTAFALAKEEEFDLGLSLFQGSLFGLDIFVDLIIDTLFLCFTA